MTPEERFTKIENFLSALADHQARHAELHQQHSEEMTDLRTGFLEMQREFREIQKGFALAIGKIAEAQNRTDQKLETLVTTVHSVAEQQRATEEKLHVLIETVDRIIRNRN